MFVVLLVIDPTSHELGSPAKPGRFTHAVYAGLDFAEKDTRFGHGGIVRLGRGQHRVRPGLRVGQRTILRGQATYSSTLWFHADYTDIRHCMTLGPDNAVDKDGNSIFSHFGSYAFGASIEEMDIRGGNVYRGASSAIIYTQGDHQPARLKNCWIRDVVNTGVHWDQGLGGPANFDIEGCDIEAGTAIPTVGSKIGVLLSGAGAVVTMKKTNVQGGASTFSTGISVTKDFFFGQDLHIENSTTGISCSQNETLKRGNTLINVTGHSSVPTLINRTNITNNTLMCINVANQSSGTTGLVVIRENGVNKHLDTVVPFYNNA